MKKLTLLTAASISLTMLAALPLTAQAATCNFNGLRISIPSGYSQGTKGWNCPEDLQSLLDKLNNSGCVVIPSTPPTTIFPDGNWNTQPETTPEKPEITPEQPDKPETGDTDTSEQLSYAEEVVRLVNQERAKNGLQPLTIAANVQAAAQVRAKEIQTSFSHSRPDGRSYSTALQEQQVSYRGSGENIAWGQKSPEQVMQGWMNSSGHRANILNAKYTTIGVGCYQRANGVNYWTQLFTY